MNKVKIEPNGDGSYILTLPDGGQRHSASEQEAIKSLKEKVEEFQNAISDMNKQIEELEAKVGKV